MDCAYLFMMQVRNSIKSGHDILTISNANIDNRSENSIDLNPSLSFKLTWYFLFELSAPDSPFWTVTVSRDFGFKMAFSAIMDQYSIFKTTQKSGQADLTTPKIRSFYFHNFWMSLIVRIIHE